MGLFSFVGKCVLGAAAIVAAPVVLPAAAAAAGTAAAAAAAGAAAAGAAATAAVGTAAAAAGTAAAAVGGAATAAVGTAAAAAGTAASAVTGTVAAAGAKVAGAKAAMAAGAKIAGGTVARVAAKEAVKTGVKIVGGAIVGGGIVGGVMSGSADKAEARGREQGYQHGFREGELSAAQRFQKMLEENENLLFGMFATALYVARLDGEAKEEMDYIESCLGHENFLREEVKHEIQQIHQQNLDFYTIRTKYLDKVSFEELHYIDDIIKEVMNADQTVSKEEKHFYENQWMTYFESIENENIGAPC